MGEISQTHAKGILSEGARDASLAMDVAREDHQLGTPVNEDLAGTLRIVDVDGAATVLVPTPTTSPNDPLNWSLARKIWHASLVLFIVGLTAATSNSAGAALDSLVDMGISEDTANIGAGVLFCGIGYTTLLLAPLVTLYGRRSVYLLCLLFSIAGSAWFANTKAGSDAIWSQLFVGASESCAEAAAQLSLSDLFYSHQRGSVMGLYILATSVGTFLGPLIAGLLADNQRVGWTWIGWSSVVISCVTLVVFLFGFEETVFDRHSILHGVPQPAHGTLDQLGAPSVTAPDTKDRAHNSSTKMEERATAHSGLPTVGEHAQVDVRKTYWQRIAIVTPSPLLKGIGFKQYFETLLHTLRVFTFPAVLYSGLQWGAQNAWLTFYLTVQETDYYDPPWNYNNKAVSLMNIPTLIGAILGCIYGGWFSDVFVKWFAIRWRNGISESEDRLWLIYPAAILNPVGLILFGVGSDENWLFPKLWVSYIGLGFVGFGWGCAGDTALSYLADCYPEMVLEGMAVVAVINNSIALIFTFCAGIWLDSKTLSQLWGKAARRRTKKAYLEFVART